MKKHTIRNEELQKNYQQHLNRIKGQIEGVINQINNNEYCVEIINQISAIRGSLLSVSKKLVNEHIQGCVISDNQNHEEAFKEINNLIDRIAK
ncbi:metal-sensitive transcriptional regulator [Spiroplasma alleghenense]|uniref:CsoR family transcriptional regulator, copper-sensing transcriptional repressor n=1 Tax=Spiroplasma alleghenense TaxID=216931 RepID=A0A345Z3R0_9MOLU|nr:metal-sensitive transcriptional regulator [Spiroplasma alleghenense]AXK51239.1 CsoR family transcriptional regulator, copper-sensing transcriptional repressor [Spiroplasma alleghenense]